MAEPRGESWFERAVRMLAQLAIPVVIVVIGAQINHSVATMDVRLKYVELAVSMLTKEEADVDQELRAWAVDVLQAYAPIPLSPETAQRLRVGEIVLPGCNDECSYYGQTRWPDDFHYQVCGNYDCDVCLEWSDPIYSPRGQVPPESP